MTPEQKRAYERIEAAVREDLARGTPRENIVAALMKKGWDQATCEQYVGNISGQMARERSDQILRKAEARKHFLHMIGGLGFLVGGIVLTLGTFMAASNQSGGGRVVIAYGAMGVGLVEFVAGLIGWVKHR